MFDRKGTFLIKQEEGMDEDEIMLELIDGGAEEVEFEEGYISVTSAMEDFGTMQTKLEELGLESETAELQRIPTTTVSLEDDAFGSVMKLIEALEDDDDVQKVYHNLEMTDEQLASL